MGLLDILVRAAAGRALEQRAPRSMPGGTPTPGSPGYGKLPGTGQMPVGNTLWAFGSGARGPVKAATVGTRYSSPGQPMAYDWESTMAIEQAYFGSLWVMRCCRAIADTAAMLPIRAGRDPKHPAIHDTNAPLAKLLGPPPGTPNKATTSRAFMSWSLTQYLVTGRWCWEAQLDPKQKGPDGSPLPVALWPLVSSAMQPVPTVGGQPKWWDKFFYQTPVGRIELPTERVIYAWRPSQRDWRQAESCLESARGSLEILLGIESAMRNLTRNGLMGNHVVVSPPFEEDEMRRAWQDQFLQEFSGYGNAGKAIFAEAEMPESGARIPGVQITPLSMTPVDAQLLNMWQQAKIDVTVDIGVPESLVGNASQRTYANSDSEYRNFWTITMLNFLREQEDNINTSLAPRVGNEVAWFDVSEVVALQPPSLFPNLDPVALIQAGVTTPQQIADYLNLPTLTNYQEAPETAPLGEEAIQATSTSRGHELLVTRSLAQIYEMLERVETRQKVPGKRLDELERWFNDNENWLERATRKELKVR